jgi:hypothetical protein
LTIGIGESTRRPGPRSGPSPPAGISAQSRNASARRRVRIARHTAEVCALCGRMMESAEPVWLTRLYAGRGVWQAPACGGCQGRGRWQSPETCGCCGRSVTYRPSLRMRLHAFCSERCRRRWYHHPREVEAELARRKTCAVCGRPFLATRRDALTCSSACRQRAYRRRIQATSSDSGAMPPSGSHRGSDAASEPAPGICIGPIPRSPVRT